MQHVHISLVDSTGEYAKKLAKQSGESDYKIHNFKQGEKVICLYEAHRYPDKIQSLTGALNSSDFCIWVIDKIDPIFAQTALALWLKNLPGMMIFTQNIIPEQVEPMLKNSPMWNWEKLQSPQDTDLREKLLTLNFPTPDSPNTAIVDSCFQVGGVGTVALTKVVSGKFKIHDELAVIPGKIKTAIRSIQEQDADQKETSQASRAGFSLKNITPDKVKRGAYLTNSTEIKEFSKGKIKFSIHPLIKDEISQKSELFLAWDLQYVSAKISMEKITAADGEKEFDFSLVAPAAAKENQQILLIRNAKSPKIIASGKITNLQ
ncbi:MAG: EF-Tu/IF-2/RF-3 family GTPase [Candidatus Micrarchaeota archaeon]